MSGNDGAMISKDDVAELVVLWARHKWHFDLVFHHFLAASFMPHEAHRRREDDVSELASLYGTGSKGTA
jgi:hypothetical protein